MILGPSGCMNRIPGRDAANFFSAAYSTLRITAQYAARLSFNGACREPNNAAIDRSSIPLTIASRKMRTCDFREMFPRVSHHVGVPEHLPVAKRELSHTVSAGMMESRAWAIGDPRSRIPQAFAQIDVLEPDRKELLIEAAELVPHCVSYGQACTGRLFNLLLLRIVRVQTAIAAIHRISRPKLIDQRCLEDQRPERR